MVRHLTLAEGEPPVSAELSVEESQAITQLELATAVRTGVPGIWDVVATSKIGVARIGELQVTVRPKISIDRLVFLMGYALAPAFWRDPNVRLDPEQDLFAAVADAFARLAVRALEQGLLHGYQSVEETLPVLRGRIRETAQMSRRFGRLIPLEVRYDDFTVDIAENRILLAAVHRLLRLPGISHGARRTLLRLRLQLSGVTGLPRGRELPQWQPSRLNARYQPAIRFAELVLAANSFEQRIGPLQVTGFVLDMWKVYEDFVCVALREAMAPYGGRSELQYRTHLDEADAVPMRPDFVWSRDGKARLVVDAKYKAEKPAGFPQADLYQVFAYCSVLGLPVGHLVYAKGSEEPATYTVTRSGVRIQCHALDLAQDPRGLLDQVRTLASTMVDSPRIKPTALTSASAGA